MARPAKPQPPTTSPVTLLWLKDQFDQIDRANVLILEGINQLKAQSVLILAEIRKVQPDPNISPALEAAILQNAALGRSIDRKVPDLKHNQTKG